MSLEVYFSHISDFRILTIGHQHFDEVWPALCVVLCVFVLMHITSARILMS
jgi:hypothetical protein